MNINTSTVIQRSMKMMDHQPGDYFVVIVKSAMLIYLLKTRSKRRTSVNEASTLILGAVANNNKSNKNGTNEAVMSHTFTLTGHTSVLSVDFYPSIELDTTSKYGLALTGFYTYNSIFNVTEECNSFAFSKNGEATQRSLQIPLGAYEISEIERAMLEVLKQATGEKSDTIFSLTANNNTLKCEIKSKFNISFPGPNSLGKLLGFSDEILKSGKKYQSIYNVDIMKVRIIRVDCNIISGAYLNSTQSHALFEFDIDVEPGYKITKEPQNNIYMPIIPDGRQYIDNITVRILDDNGDLIDFRGEKIIVKLELKKIA